MLNAKSMLNINQNPKSRWESLNQQTLNKMFDNSTMIYKIKEQVAFPFTRDYTEEEVWLDSVSDTLVNTNKVYSDFVEVLFKDCNHKQNYKGQYYKINLDDEETKSKEDYIYEDHEEYYICYDTINKLQQVSSSKLVRCNNVLTLLDESGNIVKVPCYLGTDITSTNNQISKNATVPNTRMIIMVQSNLHTANIKTNQRFMFQHSSCFKVEEINNYMQEQGTQEEVTCIKIYVAYSANLPTDNCELNLCDYVTQYHINVEQDTIEQINGFNGKVKANVLDNNGNVIAEPIDYVSLDEEVVIVDKFGNYTLVGNVGQVGQIICSLTHNPNVFTVINVKIVADVLEENILVVEPHEEVILRQGKSKIFTANVYKNNVKQQDIEINCVGSNAPIRCYSIEDTIDGFKVTNNQMSIEPLFITFSAQDCDDVIVKVVLKGVI